MARHSTVHTMKSKTSKSKRQISLHVDARTAAEVKAIAKSERRSLSAQIAFFLADAVARRNTAAAK